MCSLRQSCLFEGHCCRNDATVIPGFVRWNASSTIFFGTIKIVNPILNLFHFLYFSKYKFMKPNNLHPYANFARLYYFFAPFTKELVFLLDSA